MDIDLEVRWLYTQYKKDLGVPDCWDITIEDGNFLGAFLCSDLVPEDKDFPLFIFTRTADTIDTLKSFVVIESSKRRIWFNKNFSDRYSKVYHLGEGKKIEVDENKIIEIRSEIMGVINHIHNTDFGMAMVRAEIIRDKINKLI